MARRDAVNDAPIQPHRIAKESSHAADRRIQAHEESATPDTSARFRWTPRSVLIPAEHTDAENAPDYRVHHGNDDGPEIGAGWKRTGEKAGDYVSLQIDDPTLAQPIRANLFQSDRGQIHLELHWNRRPNAATGTERMSAPRHHTVVGRPSAVRLTAFLLLSGLLLGTPFSATANAQNASATRTTPTHPFAAYIDEAEQRFGIPAAWIRAVMRAESAGDVRARFLCRRDGLDADSCQTRGRARVRIGSGVTRFDPRDNLLAGAAFLRQVYDRYGSPGFLAAYNAGPGRYERISRAARCRPKPALMSPP